MDEFKTEEEQIAAIKNWWKTNGTSVILAIVAALAIVFGYRAWQNNVEANKASASGLYQRLLTVATAQQGLGDEQSAKFIAGEIKTNYSDTEYARFAALYLAKIHAEAGELDEAIAELDFVLASTQDVRTMHIVKARKARVLASKGEYDSALALLNATEEAFKPSYLEITGDILLAQGDEDGARETYLEAYGLVKDEPQRAPLLGVKLSDLGVDTRSL